MVKLCVHSNHGRVLSRVMRRPVGARERSAGTRRPSRISRRIARRIALGRWVRWAKTPDWREARQVRCAAAAHVRRPRHLHAAHRVHDRRAQRPHGRRCSTRRGYAAHHASDRRRRERAGLALLHHRTRRDARQRGRALRLSGARPGPRGQHGHARALAGRGDPLRCHSPTASFRPKLCNEGSRRPAEAI